MPSSAWCPFYTVLVKFPWPNKIDVLYIKTETDRLSYWIYLYDNLIHIPKNNQYKFCFVHFSCWIFQRYWQISNVSTFCLLSWHGFIIGSKCWRIPKQYVKLKLQFLKAASKFSITKNLIIIILIYPLNGCKTAT